MNFLIVFPRRTGSKGVNYEYLFPLGLAYISSVLKQAGHHVDCLNLNHYDGTVEELVRTSLMGKKRYDFVCSGGLSPHYRQIRSIVDAVHKYKSDAKLILGGGIISSDPEFMFNTLNPDYVVVGEGEKTIVELLSCIEHNGNLEEVAGIGYRDKNGKVICTKSQTAIMDLDSIPWPDFEGFEFETYLNHLRPDDMYFYDLYDSPRPYPIICSRSCPYLCTFCFHPLGNKYRQRSIDSIMHELEVMVKRYRINIIAIYDELFSHDKERVYEFCRRIKKLKEEIPWEIKWNCQMRVDGLDEEFLKTMKDAGCYMVSYGFESYSPSVLKSMRKHITPEQIDQAVHLTLNNEISIQGNFIFGDAAETLQTAHETLNYWKEHYYAGILLGFISPYPGTQLYTKCLERGIIKDKLDFIENHISDVFNMTVNMTDKEFDQLKFNIFEAELGYRVCTTPLSSIRESGGFIHKIKCPHCAEIVEYKNYKKLLKLAFPVMMYCRKCRRRYYIASNVYNYTAKSLSRLLSIMSPGLKFATFNFTRNIKPFVKLTLSKTKNIAKKG